MIHSFSAASDPNIQRELRDVIHQGKCVLLVGAELSTQISTEENEYPPHGKALFERIIDWLKEKALIEPDIIEGIQELIREGFLSDAGQEIEELLMTHRQQQQCLGEILFCDQAKASKIYNLIVDIPFRAFLTTNYETYIEMTYSTLKRRPLPRFYEKSIQNAITEYREWREREDRPFILKLQGDAVETGTINLGDQAFDRLLHRTSNYKRDLERLLSMSSILLIGFGKNDSALDGLLSKLEIFDKLSRHWMLVPEKYLPMLKAKHLQENKGIRVIQYKPDETHTELVKFLKELAIPPSPTRLASEEGPRINKVAVINKLDRQGIQQSPLQSELSQKMNRPSSSIEETTQTIKIFYSYASEDEDLRKKLEKHLRILKYNNLITEWYDREITAGQEKESEIEEQLNSANIILLLISTDFIASEYYYSVEVKRAMERHALGEARVIPVILRPTSWKDTQFSKLQVLPQNEKPVTKWDDIDEAFLEVAGGIKKVVEKLKGKTQSAPLSSD